MGLPQRPQSARPSSALTALAGGGVRKRTGDDPTARKAARAEREAAAKKAQYRVNRLQQLLMNVNRTAREAAAREAAVALGQRAPAGEGPPTGSASANILADAFTTLRINGKNTPSGYDAGLLTASQRQNLPTNAASVDITLSKNILNRLRELHTESSNITPANGGDGVEYAGIIKIKGQETTKDFMPAELILRSFEKGNVTNKNTELLRNSIQVVNTVTNGLSRAVTPSQQIVDSRITFHTHPTPQRRNQQEKLDNNEIFTMPPSIPDIQFYLNNWPKTQANIIVDQFGFYVVDVIESDGKGMFLTTQGTNSYQTRLKVITDLWFAVFLWDPANTNSRISPDNIKALIYEGWSGSVPSVVNAGLARLAKTEEYVRNTRTVYGWAQGLRFPKDQVDKYNEALDEFRIVTGVSVKYYTQAQITSLNSSANKSVVRQTLPTVTLTSRVVLSQYMQALKEMRG